MQLMKVPFVDLKIQYKSLKQEIDTAVFDCMENANFVGGSTVTKFENEFAQYLGVQHCIGCGNGTDALELALRAAGIVHGDEVIVPAVSWISTSETVSSLGATPVFVDVHPVYYTIDCSKIEEKINAKTKAIIPVHLYGLSVDMDSILRLAKKHNLIVIEDCAHAHGAEFNGQKVGSFGDLACFSFYPGKNLGAYGDGGAVVTNNISYADQIRTYANHGQLIKHDHLIEGRNSRLDTIQAAILSVKLKHLDEWNSLRMQHALYYNELLKNEEIDCPILPENGKHVFHIYALKVRQRDDVIQKLALEGVEASVHYPVALPFLKPYQKFNYTANDFPVAYDISSQFISLPMYPELSNSQIEYVASNVLKIIG